MTMKELNAIERINDALSKLREKGVTDPELELCKRLAMFMLSDRFGSATYAQLQACCREYINEQLAVLETTGETPETALHKLVLNLMEQNIARLENEQKTNHF